MSALTARLRRFLREALARDEAAEAPRRSFAVYTRELTADDAAKTTTTPGARALFVIDADRVGHGHEQGPDDGVITPSGDLVATIAGAAKAAHAAHAARSPRATSEAIDVVWLGAGVLASTTPSARRVALLEAAARASAIVVAEVSVSDEGSHAARLAVDVPRRVMRALGAPLAEPGDRTEERGRVHRFFDEEALLVEAARGGLALTARSRSFFTFTATAPRSEAAVDQIAAPLSVELARVVAAAPAAERARRSRAPEAALSSMRAVGRTREERAPIGRARLRRAIGWVDAAWPTGPSCYRRVLMELALDRGAAREHVVFGLDVGRTGHIAFAGREERAFDVVFEVGPGDSDAPGA